MRNFCDIQNAYAAKVTGTENAAESTSISLTLGSQTTLRLHFSVASDTDYAEYDNNAPMAVENNDEYGTYVEIKNIAAQYLEDTHTITIKGSNEEVIHKGQQQDSPEDTAGSQRTTADTGAAQTTTDGTGTELPPVTPSVSEFEETMPVVTTEPSESIKPEETTKNNGLGENDLPPQPILFNSHRPKFRHNAFSS